MYHAIIVTHKLSPPLSAQNQKLISISTIFSLHLLAQWKQEITMKLLQKFEIPTIT